MGKVDTDAVWHSTSGPTFSKRLPIPQSPASASTTSLRTCRSACAWVTSAASPAVPTHRAHYEATDEIDANIRLHRDVLSIALIELSHFRERVRTAIFDRRHCNYQVGVDDRADASLRDPRPASSSIWPRLTLLAKS